jgi:GH25 family lysozyme M1 (1,4-beta-N-acetylmuramidase)
VDLKLVLDTSNVNPITLDNLRASKAVALISKATEGTSFKDKWYGDQRRAARAAGVPFGAYVFLHPDSTGDEAKFFFEYARPRVGDIQPIVDAEVTTLGSAALAKRAYACLRALEARGFDPILYASAGIWTGMIAAEPRLKRYRVWEAQYPGRFARWFPRFAKLRIRLRHGVSVVLWQWTDAYTVNGHRYDASALLARRERILIPRRKAST